MASELLKAPAIATGGIFREAMAKQTAMGKQITQFVNSGLLVPDKLTNAIVAERLSQGDCERGFILDGYPRSLVQAKALDTFLTKGQKPLDRVLYFKVDAALVVDRMGQRRICGRCGATYNLVSQPPKDAGRCDKDQGELITRTDDQPESIRKRLEVYEKTTSPLLKYYEKKSMLSVINASLSVQDVAKAVSDICLAK